MLNIIENFIQNMSKEDIIKFAKRNNLTCSEHEIDFVYGFIKQNYKSVLKSPDQFNLALYKNEFSNENYAFIENLVNKYKKMI